MNLVIAVVLFAIVLMRLRRPPARRTTVVAVSDCVIPASDGRRLCTAGDPPSPGRRPPACKPGDRIVAFNGTPVTTGTRFSTRSARRRRRAVTLVVERDGRPSR